MPTTLLIVGAILVLLGMAGIAAGAPDWVLGLSLGATLIQSGAIALVGGIVVIALGLVLDSLQRVLRRFEAQPVGSPRAASGRPSSEARSFSSAPSVPQPLERSSERPSHRSAHEVQEIPLEQGTRSRRDPADDDLARARRERPSDILAGASARARRENASTGDESSRARREGASAGEESRRGWRERLESDAGDEPAPPGNSGATGKDESGRPHREFPPLPPLPMLPDERRRSRDLEPPAKLPVPRFRPAEPVPAADRGSLETKVVRSGVIGGMAYTLYADGSIEAELPIGTVRFGSIAELQDHVMRTGTEADVDFKEPSR
jgi:hypothetical protein